MPALVLFVEELDTPTGTVLVACDAEQRLRAVEWHDHAHRMRQLLARYYSPDGVEMRPTSRRSAASQAIQAYFAGDIHALADVPTATNGTAFQRMVWDALRTIPSGATISYSALAARIGRPAASRAVGLANGANPIPLVVPCHRVIGANGALTGFGGGVHRKRWLLAHEGRTLPLWPVVPAEVPGPSAS